ASQVMLGEENEQWGPLSPLSIKGIPRSLHLCLHDVDGAFGQALRAGATGKYPLENAFWGDRYGKVTDPFGHQWGLATRLKELSPEEMEAAGREWMSKAGQTHGAQTHGAQAAEA